MEYNESKIWKFTATSATVEQISASKAYILRAKVDNGEKLTDEEKLWITHTCSSNTFSITGIPVSGWMISFRDILKRYLVKSYGSWHEHYAINRKALKKGIYEGMSIQEIVEI